MHQTSGNNGNISEWVQTVMIHWLNICKIRFDEKSIGQIHCRSYLLHMVGKRSYLASQVFNLFKVDTVKEIL